MKNLTWFVIGYIVAMCVTSAVASNIGGEAIWNRVFNSSTNTITVIGN